MVKIYILSIQALPNSKTEVILKSRYGGIDITKLPSGECREKYPPQILHFKAKKC